MKAIGIILAGGGSKRMKELSAKRAVSAMPVGGAFRCIDFALSNMSNSHIQSVEVLTQYNSRSLNEHLSSSKWWNFGRKQGGLYVFTPTITEDNRDWYRGTADAMYQNLEHLRKRHEPYVVISSGDCVYKMNYDELLNFHIRKEADITVACKDLSPDTDVSRYGVVKMNEESRIIDFEEKPLVADSHTVSTGIYVIRRRLLVEMLERAADEGRFDFVTDILIRYKGVKRIFGYKMKSYWSNISTVEDYYQTNMDFLKPEVRKYFFKDAPKIYSKTDDLPPAKYNPGSQVSNSLVASGCIINSRIEDSVIFKNVFIGKNSVIKNSVILTDAYIGDNTYVENCIVESGTTLKPNTYYYGENGVAIVTERGQNI